MTEAAIWGGVIGSAVTMLGAVVVQVLRNSNESRHDRHERTSAPYSEIAARLSVVERQAAAVPLLQAHLWSFHTWSEHVIGWGENIRQMVNGRLGDPLPPMPPAPKVDRRMLDSGPPFGWDRREHGAEAASPHWNEPPPPRHEDSVA